MAENFYTILTTVGKAKIANASALGTKINLTTFVVGDSNGIYYNPTEDQTALRKEVWRGNISSIGIDKENPNWIVLETVIPSTDGGFMVREAGVLDVEGNLIAIGKYPETYKPIVSEGSAKDLYIRMILEVSNAASVTLKIDPSVVLATKKDIEVITSSMGDLAKKVSKNTEDISNINTQLADITTQQGDLQNLKTTDKTNIVGAVNELFQNANNGKQNWVDVIGSPLNIEDTFSTLKNKTQNLKNSMAEKLTTKGQDSKGIEDLQVLINKIDMLNSYDIDMLFLKYGNIFNNLTSTNTSFLGINLKSKRIISKHTIEEKFNILDFQGNVLQTFIIPQEIGVPVYYDPRNDLLLCQLNYNYNDRITIIDINNNIVSKYVFASRYETAIMYFIDSDKYIYIVTRLHDNVQGYPELRLYKLKSDGTQIATLRIDNSIDTGRIDKDNSYIKERENDIIARVMWLYSDGCIILKTNKELNRYNKVHIPGNLNINIVAETLLI
ncbi:phage tail protein [Clostridium sporogenes]|uniref:phage tail protein n=1 Tax=Clostridium sporogenes TaxID=1509 RepID=UPI00069EC79D|nr:phage tail protein [Clostridium sporogenes]